MSISFVLERGGDREAPALFSLYLWHPALLFHHRSTTYHTMERDDKLKKGRSRSGRNYYSTTDAPSGLSRSYSASVSATTAAGTSTSQQQQQQSSSRLSKKCVEAVKEHRARFYIVRRCVSMLVCWRDH